MIKNEKGFTLIELLAIVVILAILMVVAAPNMTKQINTKQSEEKSILEKKIDNAAHLYAAKYYSNAIVDCADGKTCAHFTLNDLEQDGLINLKNNICSSVGGNISILNDGGIKYNYHNIIGVNCVSNGFACDKYYTPGC